MNTFKKCITTVLMIVGLSGCGFSPISPQLKQELDNTNGQIEEIKNNQNGIMTEIGKLNQKQDITAKNIENAQQGIVNLRGNDNSGVQIFSGDGGIILFLAIICFSIILISYYRSKAVKSEKAADILAQSIAAQNNVDLENHVFMSALNTNVENEVYNLIVKNQHLMRK